jgi:predicted nucleic acid-binding protein
LPYIFVDTGAWYALLDESDANHHAAVKFNESLVHPMVTSNYIADEVITLARKRLGYKVAVEIGEKLWNESIANLIRVTPNDEKKAWEIFVKYSDKTFSFTDCTSFALMYRVGITEVFAFDDHFTQYGSFIVLPINLIDR